MSLMYLLDLRLAIRALNPASLFKLLTLMALKIGDEQLKLLDAGLSTPKIPVLY